MASKNQNKKKWGKVLDQMPATEQRLRRQDFTLYNGTSGARTKIAEYKAEAPFALREDALRLMFVTVEQFQTDGTGGNQETFNLSNNIIPSNNTTDFVLFESGNRVQPDSVDYSNDSFSYTDDGTNNYLHAYYVPRDATNLEIVKSAPSAKGKVEQVVYDDVTSVLHERNQNKEPPSMDFKAGSPLTPMVPRKWTLEIWADGPVELEWNDDSTANPQGTEAVNSVVSIPVNRSNQDLKGLSKAVKQDIID